MTQDDLDFFCRNTGYNWFFQLKESLELVREDLNKILSVISGYDINTKRLLVVTGKTESNKIFIASFYLSSKWYIPGESIYSLQELVLQ